MSDKIEIKLAAARTRLILDKPFLGALVLRLPMLKADPAWCRTTATDARSFYYNAAYIDSLSLEQTQFVLSHEALHCALSHFSRRMHRLKNRWDVACDMAINPLLIDDGLKPPANALYLEQFEDMTAEEIYPLLDDHADREPMDQHLYDVKGTQDSDSHGQQDRDNNPEREAEQQDKPDGGGDREKSSQENGDSRLAEPDEGSGGALQPPPLSEYDRKDLSVQWQQRMAGAAQQAMRAGKMGAAMARLVDHLLQPQLPWRMLLARYMTAVARDDYSFQRPSRREGGAILPSIRSDQINLAIVIDTSGSISYDEISEFISEVNAIKGQLRARITLLACDDKLSENGPWEYEAWDTFSVPENLDGGGGTSFLPPFEWLSMQHDPDLLLYFTDADGPFPAHEPHYPILWLVKGKLPVPWGQRVQLN